MTPLRLAVGVACIVVVLLVGFGPVRNRLGDLAVDDGADDAAPVEPGASRPLYLVEVAPPPDYRVLAHDPSSATTTPVFVMPEFGAIVSMALSPDGSLLALSYTKNYNTPGTGVYLLDLDAHRGEVVTDDGELVPVTGERANGIYDDLQFSPDGTAVWATLDETNDVAVVEIEVGTGETRRRIDDAVDPAVGEGWVAYLEIEPDYSRRSIGRLDLDTGVTTTVDVLDGDYDLDHLTADPSRGRLLFAALVPPGAAGIRIGEPAGAHGDHDDPVQWLTSDLGTGEIRRLAEHELVPVRDATLITTGELAVATADGIVTVGSSSRTLLPSSIITELAG